MISFLPDYSNLTIKNLVKLFNGFLCIPSILEKFFKKIDNFWINDENFAFFYVFYDFTSAITSISTSTSLGNRATSTQDLAGL